ncbi:hypothetical protein Cgig2_011267 [Carnegiea gigantea]|uniref:DUF4283 domain-containing protein n=1 Tax=Carnegiea gigantea TaxID=171969 RepID=A0A9Q1JNF0_9CARY|nr:hypothetical protein Cgig2_011267 [Carnegiea gigantea]
MIDPDEGMSLQFIRTSTINGVKCAKIDSNDVTSEIEYWQSAMLCFVLGANPPLEVIEGFIRRMWNAYDIDKICLVGKEEMQVVDEFSDFIEIINEHNVVMRQKVEYDWKPTKCSHCRMYGHSAEEYRKKPKSEQNGECSIDSSIKNPKVTASI